MRVRLIVGLPGSATGLSSQTGAATVSSIAASVLRSAGSALFFLPVFYTLQWEHIVPAAYTTGNRIGLNVSFEEVFCA